jgi:hypothetical protein
MNAQTRSEIKRLFARRQFTEEERDTMRGLYAHAELLANRIAEVIPGCDYSVSAIHQLKNCMADCESAVALNPKCDKQVEMPLGEEHPHFARSMRSPEETAMQIRAVAKRAESEINDLAAHARR